MISQHRVVSDTGQLFWICGVRAGPGSEQDALPPMNFWATFCIKEAELTPRG